MQMYHLRVLAADFQVQGAAAPCSPETRWRGSLPLPAPGVGWQSAASMACSCVTPVSTSILTWCSPCDSASLRGHLPSDKDMGHKGYRTLVWPHLN